MTGHDMNPDWLTVTYSHRALLADILINGRRFLHPYYLYQLLRLL